MRCPKCRKFVSYGKTKITVEEESIEEESLHVQFTLVRLCRECERPLRDLIISDTVPLSDVDGTVEIENSSVTIESFDGKYRIEYWFTYTSLLDSYLDYYHSVKFDMSDFEEVK